MVGVTTIIFGLVPALLLLRTQFTTDLKAGERGSSKGARRVYSVLVAAEVAMACALLVSSALLVRTVSRMMETPTGVNADDVTISTVQLSPSAVGAPARGGTIETVWVPVADVHSRILEEIRQQPGVTAAGEANFLPLEVGWRNPFLIEGQPRPAARGGSAAGAVCTASARATSRRWAPTIVRGPRVHGVRQPGFAGRRDRQRIVRETVSYRTAIPSDRSLRTWATGIGPLGTQLEIAAELSAAG